MVARVTFTRRARVLLVTGLVLIAATFAWFAWQRREASSGSGSTSADTTGMPLRVARLYFASPDGERLLEEPRELPEVPNLHPRVAMLVAALSQGPAGEGVRTLPVGTRVQHSYLDGEGVLTLDLSRAFRQGFQGGALAEEMAIGSLVRTVAAGVPEARRVRIVCGGRPLATLGGHFPLDRPLDPDDWP